MTRPLVSGSSNFVLELWGVRADGTYGYLLTLPYRNIQTEMFLNDKGAALRCEIPFRENKLITQSNLYPGKAELVLFYRVGTSSTLFFQGPIWDVTSGSDGILSVSAQDRSSLLTKRRLKSNKSYSATQPADMFVDLISTLNAVFDCGMTTSKLSSNAQTVSARYAAIDRNKASDLCSSWQAMGDGVDWFVRGTVMSLYGGKISPTASPTGVEFGGDVATYSLQVNAQTIANSLDLLSQNGLVGSATDTTARNAYGRLYEDSQSSDLLTTAALTSSAAVQIKATKNAKAYPTITSKTLLPIRDFDFGAQFSVTINDGWSQYSGLIRTVGWQLTIAQSDNYTAVIYTNDLLELTG